MRPKSLDFQWPRSAHECLVTEIVGFFRPEEKSQFSENIAIVPMTKTGTWANFFVFSGMSFRRRRCQLFLPFSHHSFRPKKGLFVQIIELKTSSIYGTKRYIPLIKNGRRTGNPTFSGMLGLQLLLSLAHSETKKRNGKQNKRRAGSVETHHRNCLFIYISPKLRWQLPMKWELVLMLLIK